ncbi:MAG: KilA-N domain-containing protein [Candidatus Pelethousia sp.]|nr:KilA-N domain-containing protein [Candidatus Pelethousia sp.]
MENLTNNNRLVMYVIAKEKYLTTLLSEGKITQSDFEKMSHFLYERFHISDMPIKDIQEVRTTISANSTTISTIEEPSSVEMQHPHRDVEGEIQLQPPAFVSLTEAVRTLTEESPAHVIQSWMRSRNTLDFLALWEAVNNTDFNQLGYEAMMEQQSGPFTMTPKQWIDQTNAIGLVSKQGRNGGTLAHPVIACEFMLWLSPAYKLTFLEMRSGS